MAQEAREAGYTFPYLHDETQVVAKSYRAACTPDFFLFDKQRRLVYRGQFDDSRPRNEIPVTGKDLRGAIEALIEGRWPDGEPFGYRGGGGPPNPPGPRGPRVPGLPPPGPPGPGPRFMKL
jgi:hypothetical protein